MRLSRFISGRATRASRSGVALIVTVIMLSVITFLAVAFLALSGREKNAVKQTTDQTTARLAADAAMVRAQSDLLAGILASSNLARFDLLVSTNYVNGNGFDASLPANSPGQLTNANYAYPNGSNVVGNDALQNLANLLYSPRPPVFITNRQAANSMEFRYYLDLNRNGRPDLTGLLDVTNNLGQPLVVSNQIVRSFVTGDPQWIGGLERIDLPHSASNKFVNRFVYAALPSGLTLDLNYIHNNAKNPTAVNNFLRNQGVGTWEINLPALLADLNTNYWNTQFAPYNYRTNAALPSTGVAFDDADTMWNWRRGGLAQRSVQTLYGGVGVNAFINDLADGYSGGLVLDGVRGYLTDPDIGRTGNPWSGADMLNHYFTTQDLFDPTKTSLAFSNRLGSAGVQASTYDQSTFYRLLSQIGTDSAPDDADKLNLNYKNVAGLSATNFVPWEPLEFFTNAAQRLLAKSTQEWLDTDANYYTNFFGTNQAFGVTRIPVLISNRFVYSPSVHRLLQMSANIADTKTDTLWPSVFRPIFDRDNAGGLYIVGYEQVPTNGVSAYFTIPVTATNVFGYNQYTNVYGVPWVVGAKKGLPNFNEISMHSMFEVTRKLQITRPSVDAPRSSWQTNLMYVIGISNAIGVEAWNSYQNAFTNPVVITVSGEVNMVLTNEFGVPLASNGRLSNSIPFLRVTNIIAPTYWPGYKTLSSPAAGSFVIPLRTNIAFLPESVYSSLNQTFNTNLNVAFEIGQGFPQPQWGLKISGRLRFIMQLGDLNGPIIDYVQLDNLDGYRQLSEEIRDNDDLGGFDGLWSTNLLGNSGLPLGVFNQLNISLGNAGGATTDWKAYGKGQLGGIDKDSAIDFFRVLYGLSPLKYSGLTNSILVQQVPFTPTKRVLQQFSWQANDPLVHYTAGDLLDLAKSNNVEKLSLSAPVQLLKNIGVVNDRFSPWGGNPANPGSTLNRFNPAVKDPLVRASDDWQFPTNVLPALGWLGRIHRGTPWQTVYLKASDLNIAQFNTPINNLTNWVVGYPKPSADWGVWSGNPNFMDAYFTRPVTDRLLFDVFTTAVNDNASRGQLSVNQTNLAAWSAVFSGVVTLTNSSSSSDLTKNRAAQFSPQIIEPAGVYDAFNTNTWPPLVRLVNGINAERTRTTTGGGFVHPGGWFKSAGDILSVPQLTDASPFLNLTNIFLERGINDAAYEWLPQQIMSLVRLGEPRFVIYAYGQALRPAENSIITTGGPFFGMCTNYQITAEVAVRAVVRVEGSPNPADGNNANPKRRYPPRLIIESYNYLPPE